MADPSEAPPPTPPATGWRRDAIDAYVAANLERWTDDAIIGALVSVGHDPGAASEAVAQARQRRRAAPMRAVARRRMWLAYGLTYLVLMVILLTAPSRYGTGQIEAVILTVVLGMAVAIGSWWVGRRDLATVGGMLSLPLVLLAVIGGTCAMTIPGLYPAGA